MPSLDDESDFSALVERHRRELQVHCYRMLGSRGARLGRVVGRDRVDHPRDPGRVLAIVDRALVTPRPVGRSCSTRA